MFLLCTANSKLGVPIKTTVSATVLEEALNGMVPITPLPLGKPVFKKVSYCFLCFTRQTEMFCSAFIAL